MYCVKKVQDDLYWVGGSDRRLALFENVFPIPRGVSYNAYVLLDEKTVLLDTVDKSVSEQFFENLEHVLGGRTLDYLVVNHMEPDHCATMGEVVRRYPEVKIVCNAQTLKMIHQFFNFDAGSRAVLVKEMDTLNVGRHTLAFVMAPMVHWPEAMVTYDTTDKILFSADAFGTFGAMNGNLFADEVNFEGEWLDDARRYYTNIVGKYGPQVQKLLEKASTLEIKTICPLHGPVWRENIGWFIEKYQRWSSYTPEDEGVVIAYASVYGNTENAANIVACRLADAGVRDVKMYDVSVTHPSVIVSEAFRASHLILAAPTYNAGLFCNMETALLDIAAHNLQNRTIAILENGTWAPAAGKRMREILSGLKNCTILESGVTVKSALKDSQSADIDALVAAVLSTLKREESAPQAVAAGNALHKLSYGLFVLTAREAGRDNGCIVNAVTQLTESPRRIGVCVNKANLTHDMIAHTGLLNVSVLNAQAPFELFKHYGFQSGRDVDKFGQADMPRTENGLVYLEASANAVISGRVIRSVDCGTHTLFLADVEQDSVLNDVPSMTYADYFDHVKPKPAPAAEKKNGYVCKICGYVYEGDVLPEDYVCPLCKHGAEDFEKIN